jgi:hypothetical protein
VKLLLESHVPPAVAQELAHRCHGWVVVHLRDWRRGAFLNAPDADLLAEASGEGFTLATYDLKTIPLLLRRLAEEGIHHEGVILIDDATVSSSDVGGLVRALAALWRAHGAEKWQDRCQFLRRRQR